MSSAFLRDIFCLEQCLIIFSNAWYLPILFGFYLLLQPCPYFEIISSN
jgi:hypothetical protein